MNTARLNQINLLHQLSASGCSGQQRKINPLQVLFFLFLCLTTVWECVFSILSLAVLPLLYASSVTLKAAMNSKFMWPLRQITFSLLPSPPVLFCIFIYSKLNIPLMIFPAVSLPNSLVNLPTHLSAFKKKKKKMIGFLEDNVDKRF